MQGAVGARVAGARDDDLGVLDGEADVTREGALQLALRALDGDGVAIAEGHLDSGGEGHGLLADARHDGSYQT